MIGMQVENQQAVQMQQFGEDWIRAITDGALDRLAALCDRKITGRLLIPAGLVKIDNPIDLVAEYRGWFGDYSEIRVETSRIATVGRKLGIFYRFLLRDEGDWYRVEQQLYCIVKDGRLQQLQLLCSGFHPAALNETMAPSEAPAPVKEEPSRDGLLEFLSDAPDTSSTCALLTPMIRSKLGELQSGQVLEVRVNDPAARGDVEAWSRLSGNALLKVIDDEGQMLRFFVKKK